MTLPDSDARSSPEAEGADRTRGEARLGRYVILGTLARGGMGEVVRARAFGAAGATKDVCLKRIRSARLADRQAVARFVDEARLSLALTHANIVSTFDFGRAENDYYLAMEWIDGADLARLSDGAADAPLSPAVVAHVGAEVARALQYAHLGTAERPGIVHCDVKPSNVLVSRSGDVKLADFGVAVARLEGMRGGTPRYMAPEQRAGCEVGPAVDMYALGTVLGELLDRATSRPADLTELVLRLTAADAGARPPALEVVSILERFVARARIDDEAAPRDDLGARAARAAPSIDLTPSMLVAESSYLRDGESETETRLTATTSSRSTPPPPAPRQRVLPVLASALGLAVVATLALSPSGPSREVAADVTPRLTIPAHEEDSSMRATAEPEPTARVAAVPVATPPPIASTVAAQSEAPRRSRPGRRTVLDAHPVLDEHPLSEPLAVDARPAHLRVNAIPWAAVELDGRPIGTTPLTRIELSPGEHSVRLSNEVLGVERMEHVVVAPGEHRDLIIDLR